VRDAGDGMFEVITEPGDLADVRKAITEAGVTVESADVTQLPSSTVPVAETDAKRLLRLIDNLDDLDDVQAVFSNYDIEDAVMEKVMADA